MKSGVLIQYKGRKSKFWLSCDRKGVEAAFRSHYATWGREKVSVGGEEVERAVPPGDYVVTFCTALAEKDGEPVFENPEQLDAVALLK